MRLKENDGTYKTLYRIKEFEIITVPTCVTGTYVLLGNLTEVLTRGVIDVKSEMELAIWTIAPLSTI